jgi:LysM repeat protein
MSDTYLVRPHDTLSSIARRHGCTIQALQSINHIKDPRKLTAGLLIRLPDTREHGQTRRPLDASHQPKARTVPSGKTSDPADGSWFRPFWQELSSDIGEPLRSVGLKGFRLGHSLLEDVLQWYREQESAEAAHTQTKTKTEQRKPDEQKRPQTPPKGDSAAKKRHKDEVIAQLHERLYATPQVVTTSGVRLSRNERRMIVAAVGLCEVNHDVFGTENLDQEFVGKRFGKRGIPTKYSDIVHIGLSYGYIQFSQDSGNLGRLLARMRKKNSKLFEETFFPNADQLIQLTTEGLSGHDCYGKSGQTYWNKLPKKDRESLVARVSTDANGDHKPDNPLGLNEEIRGARVQPIPYVPGYPPLDLWQDYKTLPKLSSGDNAAYLGYKAAFKAAGEVPAFQDVQIELAVEDFMNPVLAHCRELNVRSAAGLAFVTACAVRGGPGSSLVRLYAKVAAARLDIKRFDSAQQERACLQAIAALADVKSTQVDVAGVRFERDEARRARLLLADHYHFLKEELYDPQTYDAASDH